MKDPQFESQYPITFCWQRQAKKENLNESGDGPARSGTGTCGTVSPGEDWGF